MRLIKLLVALFLTFYVFSPDPIPVIIDDVIIAWFAIKVWGSMLDD